MYYALVALEEDGHAQLVKKARRELGECLVICQEHWDRESRHIRLAKKLAKGKFGLPVYERYPDTNEYYYGVYEFDRTGLQRNELKRLTDRAVGFFQTISDLASEHALQIECDTYRAAENRQSVARHLRRERRSHAATLRKQFDNYRCQVCRFDFSQAYGKLGDDFAEAHHIVPLESNSTLRSTTIDDLITVCSNCHRMLHRMTGTPDDVPRLRQIVRRHR